MAAAEARAAWQRAANRCLVQEDRKRAPKLACCQSSSEQHGTNNGNCVKSEDRPISTFMPLSCNPMNSNLSSDIRWWIQLQPNFGVQKDLVSEAREKKVEDSAPKPKREEPLLCETISTKTEKSANVFEPPLMVSSSFTKYSSETGLEQLRAFGSDPEVPLKCRGAVGNCLYEDKELTDFRSSDPPLLKSEQKANFDMNASWKEVEKTQPWWQITDEDKLASLVAERTIQHIENCDLPRPTQTVCVHKTESRSHKSLGHSGGPSSPAIRVAHPVPEQCEHINFSYSSESTYELNLSNNRVWPQHEKNYAYSSNTGSESKQTFHNASERDQILEALCHSQTRAREAELAAKKAFNEKDDVINLLLRQASHLFACNQWLKILQLENIGLQLKHNGHQIETMVPELPWMALKEKPAPGQERKESASRKERRQKKGGGFFDAILFAVGLGLAGAGFLLGWTLGWLLPKM